MVVIGQLVPAGIVVILDGTVGNLDVAAGLDALFVHTAAIAMLLGFEVGHIVEFVGIQDLAVIEGVLDAVVILRCRIKVAGAGNL